MACKVPNLIGAILLVVSFLLVLLSLEPKKAGGYMKLSYSDEATTVGGTPAKTDCIGEGVVTGLKQEYLVHPLYISKVKMNDGTDMNCDTYDWTYEGLSGMHTAADDNDSCTVNLLDITRESHTSQLAYAHVVFQGAAAASSGVVQQGGFLRRYFDTAIDGANTLHTQEAVFKLLQASGTFLAFGIICHILAIAMGGFIWNYSKACNFGPCQFIFNSMIWAGLALVCYIMSLACFSGIYLQGEPVDEDHTVNTPGDCAVDSPGGVSSQNVEVKEPFGNVAYSPGGAMVIAAIVFKFVAITLASYQWYVDSKHEEEEKVADIAANVP